jgi:hypothetical protein
VKVAIAAVGRPDRSGGRPTFGRLFGVALLGWFGLMLVVTALAL